MKFASVAAIALSFVAGRVLAAAPGPLNPPSGSITHPVASLVQEKTTNAKRLADGLPPLAPRASRVHGNAPRAAASGTPSKYTAYVKLTSADGFLGYLSTEFNEFGEYGILTQDKSEALQVSYPNFAGYKYLSFSAVNTKLADFPYIGATVGYSSSSPSLGNATAYAFLTGNKAKGQFTPPYASDPNSFSTVTGISKGAETAIWTFPDEYSGLELKIWWVNPNYATVFAQTVYVPGESAIAVVADGQAFLDAFGVEGTVVTLGLDYIF